MDLNLPSEKQFEIWRKMSLEEKYQLFLQHMSSVRELKKAGLRLQHPDWSEEALNQEIVTIFKRGVT